MRVLIIGLGSIALKHISALRSLHPDAEIIGLRSTNSNVVDGVRNIYSYSEIPDDIDFAIISNPTHKHFEVIENLVTRNMPLFLEKPVVSTRQQLEALNVIMKKHSEIKTYVGCNLRFHSCIEYLKLALAENEWTINEVNTYCGSYLPAWRPNQDFRTLYSANAAMGGGVHLDLFHEIDYMVWLMGYPEKSQLFRSAKSMLKIDASDYATFLLEYKTFNVNIVLNYYRPKPRRSIEIVFENEIWNVDLLTNTIFNLEDHVIFSDYKFDIKDTYVKQLAYFISKLSTDDTPMNNIEESLEILKICLQDA